MLVAIKKPVLSSLVAVFRRSYFPTVVLVAAGMFLGEFLTGQLTQLLIGATAIYLTAQPGKMRKGYLLAAIAFLLLTLLVPLKTAWYFGAAAALFWWAETQGYRIGFLGLTAFLVSSPAFGYFAAVFSFGVRLQLANAVGTFFSIANSEVAVQGNVIRLNGNEFSVDPACMGLYMLSVSLLMGICLLGLLQRKLAKRTTIITACAFLLAVGLLNVFANAIRIIVLVQFAILPEDLLHEVVGLGCLLVYVCLPSFYLARWTVRRGRPQPSTTVASVRKPSSALQMALLCLLLFAGVWFTKSDTYTGFAAKQKLSVAGYASSLYAPGILKLESPDALIYIKYIRGFYDTDHNPTICWKGSGYQFEEVQSQTVQAQTVFTAVLNNGTEKLYTAWWYGNGRQCTINQWDWRKDMLSTGGQYAVINVTANTKAGLMLQLQSIIGGQRLKPLFR